MTKTTENNPSKAQRHSTDVLFALLIILSWFALTAIGVYVYRKGDYRVVLYPMDYDGNICGTDYGNVNMTEYSKIVYVNSFGGGVCVKECPKVPNWVDVNTLVTYGGVYQGENANLTKDFIQMADYSSASKNYTCNDITCPMNHNYSWFSIGIRMGSGFAYYATDTYEIFGNRCLMNPKAKQALRDQVYIPSGSVLNIRFVDNAYEFWRNLYGDLFTAKEYVFGFGFVVSLVLGLTYATLLRIKCLVASMIWLSILVTISAVFAIATYVHFVANQWRDEDPQTINDNLILGAKISSYVIFGVGGLLVCLVLFLRKEIHLATAIVQVAGKAIGSMPFLVVFPVFKSIALISFIVAWLFYAVHLASLGNPVAKSLPLDATVTIRTFQFDDLTWKLAWYLLFSWFWTTTFIGAMGEIIISMSIARWYFTRDKSKVGSCSVFDSIGTVLRYHMGTAAFGSLILAIILFLRAIIMYFQKKAQQLGTRVGEALLCCCQCCLWCFQKFIEFISKNAYIQTAIFGTPFCESSREAFGLITRNAARVGCISYVSVMVVFVGRFFISICTAAAAWVVMERYIGSELYSLAGPSIFVFLISYLVADMFMKVFDMSTTTILHCFVADEEMFDGPEQYAEDELRKFLDDSERNSRKVLQYDD